MQRMRLVLTLIGLLAIRVGGRIESSRRNILWSCLINLIGSLSCLILTEESLTRKARRKFTTKNASNPLSFLSLAAKSVSLRALTPILIAQAIPDYDYTSRSFYRQKFKWKVKETSNLMFCNQISGIIESFLCPENSMIKLLGVKATTQLSCVLGSIQDFNAAFTNRPESIFLNAFLSPFMHGRTAINTLVSEEAKNLSIGHGELAASLANLYTPLRFCLPTLFSELFANFQKTTPQINFIVTGVTQLILCGVIIPTTWKTLKPLAEKVETNYGKVEGNKD
eukprot:CAMPEP_0184493052 /NCGR_PEP_ID=MMETSP0113_2-20130426/24977_1 /TAXON_ID=91329 /ORGANISM="Norrisiella sphaerica, Strain BC52" /LENGTH=280 /DNA_ID=CAMNT_0026878171 /DNA_START=252 /DNA_END=1094 /DNA_ORIENTATION=+